ncbi:B9 domain-containing protein, partial [Tribonema minus]
AVWNHPLDIHYGMDSFRGWPRLQLQVWQLDAHDRSAAAGYGMCAVPLAPGAHDVECVTWRPRGTFFQRLSALFLGAPPQLEDARTITSCADRTGLRVESCGTVRLHLEVITAGMAEVGARLGSARGCLT